MGQIPPCAGEPLVEILLLQHEGDEGLRGVRVFSEVERQDRHRELQFRGLADRADRVQRMVGVFGEVLLALLQRPDFFFDAVLDKQAISHHFVHLADAVSAVDGLVFHRRVPPRIEEHDIVGRREVQAKPARFEGN